MKLDHFTAQRPGELVRNLEGHWAFVPHPLPGRVLWSDDLVSAISCAEAALGKLSGLGSKFPRPHRLVRLFLRREAELSSRIEDTYAGVRTQLLFRFVPDVRDKSPDALEVENHFQALEFGLKAIKRQRIGMPLIRQMHSILLRNVRGQEKTPGQFRKMQAHIGRTANIDDARFVPPPPHAVGDCMEALERFLKTESTVPRIALLAMVHYQFEAIHPFSDGNGRIGRVLILLLMLQMGILPLPLFNPSAYLENNRREYYDHLLNVSQRGSWAEWIHFFSNGIVEECSQTNRRIEQLEDLRQSYQRRIRRIRSSGNLSLLVDELFANPRVRLNDVARLLDVWPGSAQRAIDRLVALDILREVTGAQRNRVYLAHEIVNVFSTRRRTGWRRD